MIIIAGVAVMIAVAIIAERNLKGRPIVSPLLRRARTSPDGDT